MQFTIKKTISYAFTILLLSNIMVTAHAAGDKKAFGYSDRYGVVTPAQVYSILASFNKALIVYSKKHKRGLASKIRSLKMSPMKGKTPEHVFIKLASLSDTVDKLARSEQVESMPRVKKAKAKAIPAEVFIQAGHNLDSLIKYMSEADSGYAWSVFYDLDNDIGAKTPSDVYALADLALRRLKLIL